MGSKKPLKSRTPTKKRSFPKKVELLEISYFQDCAKYTNIPSKCREHSGWDIYGILTGYNPLLCFTFTSSEMFHQLRLSNLKLYEMLRRPKKHTGAHYAGTRRNYQIPIFFGRVFTGFHGQNTGFPRASKRQKPIFFPNRVEKRSFRIALWDSTGFVRVFYGFQKIQLFGHHQHDESCNDWSLSCFLVSWHYTVMLWAS